VCRQELEPRVPSTHVHKPPDTPHPSARVHKDVVLEPSTHVHEGGTSDRSSSYSMVTLRPRSRGRDIIWSQSIRTSAPPPTFTGEGRSALVADHIDRPSTHVHGGGYRAMFSRISRAPPPTFTGGTSGVRARDALRALHPRSRGRDDLPLLVTLDVRPPPTFTGEGRPGDRLDDGLSPSAHVHGGGTRSLPCAEARRTLHPRSRGRDTNG
jgi:hypothetical protein